MGLRFSKLTILKLSAITIQLSPTTRNKMPNWSKNTTNILCTTQFTDANLQLVSLQS